MDASALPTLNVYLVCVTMVTAHLLVFLHMQMEHSLMDALVKLMGNANL